MPTHIRVWTNRKPYPEIMAFCFDGTAFGTEEAPGYVMADVEVRGISNSRVAPPEAITVYDDLDDDIPF